MKIDWSVDPRAMLAVTTLQCTVLAKLSIIKKKMTKMRKMTTYEKNRKLNSYPES